ncbi:hypothetical protein [Magnetospirillum sp. UT-4]|nr:hypothetical protein [Magnetospirillum sp. UT-4]CAA7620249.1 conserved hypothetical protein [Magnetospirillum sp. UT-4]
MLEEWIHNLPIAELRRIASDPKVEGGRIWHLAVLELMARQRQALAA